MGPKIRVADYIADFLAAHEIRHVFLVTGGGAMHLNDAFGRHPDLQVICCHHEQACSIAAESYFRLSGRLAAVNVTTGPGGINALTGVHGAYVDSMAMLVISGQVKWETTVRSTGLPLRQLGDQEVDIVKMVEGITKYAVMVTEPRSIRYHLERALHLCLRGRPGPCWLDVPLNVQGALIEPDDLPGYDPAEDAASLPAITNLKTDCVKIAQLMAQARRPAILAGTGIRLSGQYPLFCELVSRWGIPVVTAWNSNDLLPDDHPAYAGRPGTLGNRAGNFVVQNADLLLILGSRINIRMASYNWSDFARAACKIWVDVDALELQKPTVRPDFPVHADLRDFLPEFASVMAPWRPQHQDWLQWCRERVKLYPVTLPEYWKVETPVNPYCFVTRLFEQLEDDEIVVCADGTACVTAFQAAHVKPGQRIYHNSGCAPMGYDLPAAFGAAVATGFQRRIICIAGDGSIMMNLQELQTIAGRQLPIKIFLLNNQGYHSIRQTQRNFFPDNIVGCGLDSGLSFPSFSAISEAFGIGYSTCREHRHLPEFIRQTLATPGTTLGEVFLDLAQPFAPKTTSRKLDDGRMITAPLEDMAPFLSREELAENMLSKGDS